VKFVPQIEKRFPLEWPAGRQKTRDRKSALWRNDGRRVSFSVAERRLIEQVNAMTRPGHDWRVLDQVLSCNIRFTLSGARDRNYSQREPDDCGVAFYFALDGRPHVLACDRWDAVADNVAAVAAHIEALRGQERWGVADLRQAFAGHVALPAPEQWWQVLGLKPAATLAEAEAAYKRLALDAHPDRGGSNAAMARLNAARDAARNAR
jgi:hypothetical protein